MRTISHASDYAILQRFTHRECHCVHLHEHLEGEEGEEDEVGVLLELVQPLGLVMMLRRLIRKKMAHLTQTLNIHRMSVN